MGPIATAMAAISPCVASIANAAFRCLNCLPTPLAADRLRFAGVARPFIGPGCAPA
jgi:hypothetical protein